MTFIKYFRTKNKLLHPLDEMHPRGIKVHPLLGDAPPKKGNLHPSRRFYQNMRPDTIIKGRLTPPFYYWENEKKGLKRLNAIIRGTVAADGSTEANLYLLLQGADATESLPVWM